MPMDNTQFEKRLADIQQVYKMLDELKKKCGGKRLLINCTGKMNWPQCGVYFFFEPGKMHTPSVEL